MTTRYFIYNTFLGQVDDECEVTQKGQEGYWFFAYEREWVFFVTKDELARHGEEVTEQEIFLRKLRGDL